MLCVSVLFCCVCGFLLLFDLLFIEQRAFFYIYFCYCSVCICLWCNFPMFTDTVVCRRLVFLFLFWLLCLFIISTVKAAVGNTYLLITVVSAVVLVVTSITPVQQTFVLFIVLPFTKQRHISSVERERGSYR